MGDILENEVMAWVGEGILVDPYSWGAHEPFRVEQAFLDTVRRDLDGNEDSAHHIWNYCELYSCEITLHPPRKAGAAFDAVAVLWCKHHAQDFDDATAVAMYGDALEMAMAVQGVIGARHVDAMMLMRGEPGEPPPPHQHFLRYAPENKDVANALLDAKEQKDFVQLESFVRVLKSMANLRYDGTELHYDYPPKSEAAPAFHDVAQQVVSTAQFLDQPLNLHLPRGIVPVKPGDNTGLVVRQGARLVA